MSIENENGNFVKPMLGDVIFGKCPIDGRENRPVFIITNNKQTLAMADGKKEFS